MSTTINLVTNSDFIAQTDKIVGALKGFEITSDSATASSGAFSVSFTGAVPNGSVKVIPTTPVEGATVPLLTMSASGSTLTLTAGEYDGVKTTPTDCYILLGAYVKVVRITNLPLNYQAKMQQSAAAITIENTATAFQIPVSIVPQSVSPAASLDYSWSLFEFEDDLLYVTGLEHTTVIPAGTMTSEKVYILLVLVMEGEDIAQILSFYIMT